MSFSPKSSSSIFLLVYSCVFLAFNFILHLKHHASKSDSSLASLYLIVYSLLAKVQIPGHLQTERPLLYYYEDLLEYHFAFID